MHLKQISTAKIYLKLNITKKRLLQNILNKQTSKTLLQYLHSKMQYDIGPSMCNHSTRNAQLKSWGLINTCLDYPEKINAVIHKSYD